MMYFTLQDLNDVYASYIGICRKNTEQSNSSFRAIQASALLVALIKENLQQQGIVFHFEVKSETYKVGKEVVD